MAWKSVAKSTLDIKTKNPGTQWTGTYTGFKKIRTELGENTIWEFHDDDMKPFGIFGFSNLNFQMEGVAPGTNCRITYKGKSTVKNKFGKFPHQVLVEVENEDAEEVGQDPMDEPAPE